MKDIFEAAGTIEDKLQDIRDEALATVTDNVKKIKITKHYREALKAAKANDLDSARKHVAEIKKIMDPASQTFKTPKFGGTRISGGDVEQERDVLVSRLQDSLTGALRNIAQKYMEDMKTTMTPEEFAKFRAEFDQFDSYITELTPIIKSGDAKVLSKYGTKIVNKVKDASYGLNARARQVIENGLREWPQPGAEKAKQEKEKFAKTLSAPDVETADAFFAQQGVSPSEFGIDPDAEMPDDPEGNEIPMSSTDLREDFASKIRKMLSESYEKSYKEATKKLL